MNNIEKYMKALVARILSELQVVNEKKKGGKTLNVKTGEIKKPSKSSKLSIQRIGKIINVVRYITELKYFTGRAL
jgi:hypothetical protein